MSQSKKSKKKPRVKQDKSQHLKDYLIDYFDVDQLGKVITLKDLSNKYNLAYDKDNDNRGKYIQKTIQFIESNLDQQDLNFLTELKTHIEKFPNKASKKGEKTVGHAEVRTAIEDLNSKFLFRSGAQVKIKAGKSGPTATAELVRDHQETRTAREQHRPKCKTNLAKLFYEVIFKCSFKNPKIEFTSHGSTKAKERLNTKLIEIWEKPKVNLALDSGSTTTQIAQLMVQQVVKLPLDIDLDIDGTPEKKTITFRIITNSPSIAHSLTASKKVTNTTAVCIIGGQIRSERDSVCGLLAQQALKDWQFNFDLSVIGVTGYRSGKVYCDDPAEAEMKSELLSRGNLKVLLFDSAKLRRKYFIREFAQIIPSLVDLVLVDDGIANEHSEDVENFVERAKDNGVVCMVLKTKKSKNSEQAKKE